MTGPSSSTCGYCRSDQKSSKTIGIWMYQLTVEQYQLMLDFGWRRSGKYLYKPIMRETCCPAYTIRLDAQKFEISKSQSKVLRRMKNYLKNGGHVALTKKTLDSSIPDIPTDLVFPDKAAPEMTEGSISEVQVPDTIKNSKRANTSNSQASKGSRDLETLLNSLENLQDANHELVMKFERAEFRPEVFELYKKYQMFVHNDPESKLTAEGFTEFLVDSPLIQKDGIYGTFHHKYYIDGMVIAVAVLDVLPGCLSSVYFFYDPDYGKLGLGNVSALKEISLTAKFKKLNQSIRYYYTGYYIHSCDKMKYKGGFKPSDLLCPVDFIKIA